MRSLTPDPNPFSDPFPIFVVPLDSGLQIIVALDEFRQLSKKKNQIITSSFPRSWKWIVIVPLCGSENWIWKSLQKIDCNGEIEIAESSSSILMRVRERKDARRVLKPKMGEAWRIDLHLDRPPELKLSVSQL